MSKNILLGITGSVAASKSEILFGKVSKNNNVKIITTDAGSKYLTSAFLKNNEIISSWDDLQGSPHIELARWAEVFLIYPATANFISKMAMGIADDLLLSTVLMYNDPIYLAPAMHEEMYLNPIIQKNILELSKNNIVCGPRFGNLDIGDTGYGRMIEPPEMLSQIEGGGKKVVVTSGGTFEMIDAVRTISNQSSGKQGRALGLELLARGFDVTYVHAKNIKGIPHATNKVFSNSNSLVNILNAELTDASYLYMAAAVSDFIPEFINEKMDRRKGPISVDLTPNQDILKELTKKFPDVISIGFSAQINDNLNFEKIKDKNVNFLVINNISTNKIGSDLNQINLINQNELIVSSDRLDKNSIAKLIIDYTIE